MKAVILAALVVSLMGCTSMQVSQNLASGSVGCSPEDITITNEDVDNGVHTFMATCQGVDYFCTYHYPNPISCKEAAKPASASSTP